MFPEGVILNRDLKTILPLDQQKITEYVTRSWYQYGAGDQAAKHPWDGETQPNYTGPKPPYEFLETDAKYSWLKAPRYDDKAMEVGSAGAGAGGLCPGTAARFVQVVDLVLQKLGVGPEALFSTLGRTAARGIETLVVAEQLVPWLDELATHIGDGDLQVFNGDRWDPVTWPKTAKGWGHHEAPRGALGHWLQIADQKVANYQAVVPSTWNGSPRDSKGNPGAYEAALVGTPVADPEQPLEILRTIHSFDPCMACAVHVVDARGREVTRVQWDPGMTVPRNPGRT